MRETSLIKAHEMLSARLVDFSGWKMPLHYGSQVEEHQYVRENAGMFDVSHMVVLDCIGEQAGSFLQWVLANDVKKLKHPQRALYSCMLNERGTILDDLIVYFLAECRYMLVVNAATAERDVAWLQKEAVSFSVDIHKRVDTAIIAIQGPKSRSFFSELLNKEQASSLMTLRPFQCREYADLLIACTGYTGEDGIEIVIPARDAMAWWEKLLAMGVRPVGLGARDTLRLEAGLNLYGLDMDESVTPFEANVGWTVSFSDRNFMGKTALIQMDAQHPKKQLVGLRTADRIIFRSGMRVMVAEAVEGVITSGSFSPTLGVTIAMARIPAGSYTEAQVVVRGTAYHTQIVPLPFYNKDLIHDKK